MVTNGFDLVEKIGTAPKLYYLRYQPQIWNSTSSDFSFCFSGTFRVNHVL